MGTAATKVDLARSGPEASETTANPPADFRGRRLGEFVLEEKLNEGGFGEIYLARQAGLERRAVVKILHSLHLKDERTRLRFLREARLASTLDHPYAAHLYAFGVEPDGMPWIAMELVRGVPLNEVFERGAMPLREFVPLLERLCEVVETAHVNGIVHRDITPRNVLVLERAGTLLPKLLDLGIAKDARGSDDAASVTGPAQLHRQEDAAPETMPESSVEALVVAETLPQERTNSPGTTSAAPAQSGSVGSLTSPGEAMGSPPYMAPEQWLNAEGVDHHCDIYSLGVLAYEAVAGRRPFSGGLDELKLKHQFAPVPWLPEDLPGSLQAVLERAMAKEAASRFDSALELARAFREASGMGAEGAELPRLAPDVAALVQRAYPQPLAEAVLELEAMRNAYRTLDAAARLVRVSLRLLTVIGLAAWVQDRGSHPVPLSAAGTELLSALRKRRLDDEEWLELLRATLAPFAARRGEHPVPELVPLVDSRVMATLVSLVARQTQRAVIAQSTDREAAAELSKVLAQTSEWLRALEFLSDYPLAVVGADGHAELWSGVRRKHRIVRELRPDARLEPEVPILLGKAGATLVLSPLAVAARPSPHAEPELFLLEGRGRRGLLLVASGGFEQTSEAALAWLNQRLAVSNDPDSSAPTLEAPYRGLAPLTAADADVFFGREREVEAFVNRLCIEPLLAVVGPSGAGKSSFVRAGVIPSLSASFHAVVFRPSASPLRALRAALLHLGVRNDDLSAESDAAEVAARLHSAARARDETLVLCVDQFEETFTLGCDASERAVFAAWLVRLATTASDPVRVVLTLRDDFLARAQQESAFEQRLAPGIELLATPPKPALRRILVEPARRAGFAFESDALVDEMVGNVEGRPGALSLLSFTAGKLWEQRDTSSRTLTAAAYQEMGGVAGALAKHAEDVLERMAPRQRELVREAFRRLVTAEGTRAITRHEDLIAILGGDEAAHGVIEKLVAARLLILAEGDDGAENVEVIHEALLSSWPRLLHWQQEDAAGTRFRDLIRAAAQQWEARHRPRSLLWRDELVQDYRRWRLQHPGGLTAGEEAFGKASLADHDRARRLRAGAIALLAMAAVFTSFLAWRQTLARKAAQKSAQEAERATHVAERATEETRQAKNHAEQSAFRARDAARIAAAHLHAEDPTTQLALLRDVESSEPLPEWAPEARAALHAGVASVVYTQHTGQVFSVAYSPDGRRVASGGQDKILHVWNADGSGTPLLLRGHTGWVWGVAFSPDGRRIASASEDRTVRVWNADGSGTPVVLPGHTGGLSCIAFSADGRTIASGSLDKTVRVWNADGSGAPVVLLGHTGPVRDVAFSADGRFIASGSGDNTVRVWRADGSGKPLVLRGHGSTVYGVTFSRDGRRVASSSWDETVRVWDVQGAHKPLVLRGPTEQAFTKVAFSPDGLHLAAASTDRAVRIWSADGKGEPRILKGHTEIVQGIAFSPDGRRLASASQDGTARVWNIDVPDDPRVLDWHTEREAYISPDLRRVVTVSSGYALRVWDADHPAKPVVLRGHTKEVVRLAFSPDGNRFASVSMDGSLRVWKADGSGAPLVHGGYSEQLRAVAFSPDGRRVAAGSLDKTIQVWNVDGTGEPVVLRYEKPIEAVAFSPDGHQIASGSRDGTVEVRNADGSGEPLALRGHTGVIKTVSFSPDGSRIVSSSVDDKTVRIWSASGVGDPVVLPVGPGVVSAIFSPDGRQIAAGSPDNSVRIWNADGAGDPVVLRGRSDNIVSFSSDGRHLFSSSGDKAILIWSDFAPLLPTDPRLWQATNYCLSSDLLTQLLAVDDDVAQALRARCLERVAQASSAP